MAVGCPRLRINVSLTSIDVLSGVYTSFSRYFLWPMGIMAFTGMFNST